MKVTKNTKGKLQQLVIEKIGTYLKAYDFIIIFIKRKLN